MAGAAHLCSQVSLHDDRSKLYDSPPSLLPSIHQPRLICDQRLQLSHHSACRRSTFEVGLHPFAKGVGKEIAPGVTRVGGPSGSHHSLRDRAVRRHPVRGPIAQDGSDPYQRARRRRNRTRHRSLCAFLEWRRDRDVGPVGADHSDLIVTLPISRRQFVAGGGLISYGTNWPINTGARPITSIASSRARSRLTCRCRRRPSLTSSSTSPRRRHSASKCHPRCSPAPTR